MDLFSVAAISEKWHSSTDCTWGIGIFFWISFSILFVAFSYMRQGIVIECGYPKRKSKYMKKKLAGYSFLDRIFLLRLVIEAETFGFILLLSLLCHWLSLLSYISSTVGFLGILLCPGKGWAEVLLVYPSIYAFILTGVLEFVPHIVLVPSIRRMYR